MKNVFCNLKPYGILAYLISLLTALSAPCHADAVTGFTLVNSASNTDIYALSNGATINLSSTGSSINIRANTDPATVGKVVFSLDGKAGYATENVAPYLLAGDTNGNYNDWSFTLGTHTLTATPYTHSGVAGTPLTITFTIVSGTPSTDPPTTDPPGNVGSGQVTVQGELKKWHKITLRLEGPSSSETASNNPFLNYRFNVTFTNGSKSYRVPGYFAADGNAGESSATAGTIWKAHFAPDEAGTWSYTISLRTGTNVAVNDDPSAGTPVSGIDGKTGSFTVSGTDKSGRDLRAKGRLRYVGQHHLQFAETGEYFVKGGVDSPENFLAYNDFDGTPNNGNRRKSWAPHVQDWRSGDPTWQGGKGKGIIGAINYLADQGLNAFSFLTMNINGDDQNVYPYISSSDFGRFDCSKLDQWEKVFEHADSKGMHLHFKLQEVENNNLLDNGNLGVNRKVYVRELIARFGHHLALNWNIGEENTQSDAQRKDMARYFSENDPYKHPIVLHTFPGDQGSAYTPLLGNNSAYTGASIQTMWNNVYAETRKWVQNSANAGKKWVVANDEQNGSDIGVAADADYSGNRGSIADNQNDIRREVLWGNLMAHGAGVEYYFGYSTGETDLTAQDFRSRAKMLRFTRHALEFFKNYVRVNEVTVLGNTNNGWMLGKDGQMYVLYLKYGGSANVSINTAGTYRVQWYDPRNGGSLQTGSVASVSGGGTRSIGNPPSSTGEDWVVLIQKDSQSGPVQPSTTVYRINSGGKSYTTTDAKNFSGDSFYSGGSSYLRDKNIGIANTNDDDLYLKERYGIFNYNFPVSSGTYTVILHFAEIHWNNPGSRKFNVDIEGQRKLTEYDIVAQAGGNFRAKQETFTVTVTDGTLNINFSNGSADQAKVSAIEVIPSGSASGRLASVPFVEGQTVVSTYPNPTTGHITVSGLDTQCSDLSVSVTNGVQTFYPRYAVNAAGRLEVMLDGMTTGLYILRIKQCSKDITQKVLIRK